MRKILSLAIVSGMAFLMAAQSISVKLKPEKSEYNVGDKVKIFWKSVDIPSSARFRITLWRKGDTKSLCRLADNVSFSAGTSGYDWVVPSKCKGVHSRIEESLTSGYLKLRIRWKGHPVWGESKWFKVKLEKLIPVIFPDLGAYIKCPKAAYPGQELGKSIKVSVWNKGLGTASNFSVDLVLSSDTSVPVTYATYSHNFHEDVLLKGGREHMTTLAGKKTANLTLNGSNKIPDDVTPGWYYLATVVDPGDSVKELNEKNNVALCRIKIIKPRLPDLVVDGIEFRPVRVRVDGRVVSDCDIKITLKNIGGTLPDAAYGTTTGMGVQIWLDGVLRGGLGLFLADPAKDLKAPGGVRTFYWGPGSDIKTIGAGPHVVRIIIVDVGNVVAEANESNNSKTVNITCDISE